MLESGVGLAPDMAEPIHFCHIANDNEANSQPYSSVHIQREYCTAVRFKFHSMNVCEWIPTSKFNLSNVKRHSTGSHVSCSCLRIRSQTAVRSCCCELPRISSQNKAHVASSGYVCTLNVTICRISPADLQQRA